MLAGGASLEVNGVVEDRDNVARAPSLSFPGTEARRTLFGGSKVV